MKGPKLTEAEKLRRQHERKADRMNAKAREDIGPLFAEQAPQTTPEAEYWRWRFTKARVAEERFQGPGIDGLDCVREQAMFRLARQLIGGEVADRLHAYAHHTYPSVQYWIGFWREVLTGRKSVELSYHWEHYPEGHVPRARLVVDEAWPPEGAPPLIDPKEFEERFPVVWPDPIDHATTVV